MFHGRNAIVSKLLCREKGAKTFCCYQPRVICGGSTQSNDQSPIERIFVSNSVALDDTVAKNKKFCVVSIAKELQPQSLDFISNFEEQQ